MTAPLRAITYARVSTTDQATEGTSLTTQEEQTAAFVKSKGWTHVEHIVDEGVSGAKDTRPGLDHLMARCRAGEADVVVVTKLDRFSRSMKHLTSSVGELDELGISFVSVAESIDSTTPAGRMMRSLLGTFAEFERERIIERMADSHRKVALDGFWRGGPPPFGFRLVDDPNGTTHTKLVVDEEERDLLHRVADLIVNQGYTTYSATILLNAEGITTRSGNPWRHSNLRWHLRSRHLTGAWACDLNGERIEMALPAIFTEEEWDQIQEAIKGSPRPQRKSRVYALTGQGRCHLRCDCGGNLSGKHDATKGISWYVCSRNPQEFGEGRCPHQPRSFRTDHIDNATIMALMPVFTPDYLTDLAAAYLGSASEGPDDRTAHTLRSRLAGLHDQKKGIARKLADGGDLDYLEEAVADIEMEESALRAELHYIEVRTAQQIEAATIERQLEGLVDRAKERLANLTLGDKAALFDLLEVNLVRVDSRRFEGTASIPIPSDGGEIWAEGPRHRELRRPRSGRVSWRA